MESPAEVELTVAVNDLIPTFSDVRSGYRVFPSDGRSVTWIHFQPVSAPIDSTIGQGWKLHISGTVHNFTDVFKRAVAVLTAENVAFKSVSSLMDVQVMNFGSAGGSQVGKLITAYTAFPDQARRLCLKLDEALSGLAGPTVPFDQHFGDGVVYYRYGAFDRIPFERPSGLLTFGIRRPDNSVVEDLRSGLYRPEWVPELFPESSPVIDSPEDDATRQRFVPVATVAETPKSTVQFGLDLATNQTVAIKRAKVHSYPWGDERSASDLLEHEYHVLRQVQNLRIAPRPIFFERVDASAVLVTSLSDGLPLDYFVREMTVRRRHLATSTVKAVMVRLAKNVRTLHDMDIVHGDLKPANIHVVGKANYVVELLDFEMACDAEQGRAVAATRGYRSRSLAAGHSSRKEDDIFALGTLLGYLVTGFDFSRMADEDADRHDFVQTMRPAAPESLLQIIRDTTQNGESSVALDVLIEQLSSPGSRSADSGRALRRPAPFAHVNTPHIAGDLHLQLLSSLVAAPLCVRTDSSVTWPSHQPYAEHFDHPYLNLGSAGVLLELCASWPAQHSARETVRAGCEALCANAVSSPGLYMGGHGTALALALASRRFTAPHFRLSSQRLFGELPYPDSFDLFNGRAGVLAARAMATILLDDFSQVGELKVSAELLAREVLDDIEAFLSNRLDGLLGMAHGLAGVGASFLAVNAVAPSNAAREGALAVSSFLVSAATRTGASRAHWPERITDPNSTSVGWCHGTAGIGTFLAEVGDRLRDRNAWGMAEKAAEEVAQASRTLDATSCHGIAGSIEFLLDMYQYSGKARWRNRAMDLVGPLCLHAVARNNGMRFVSEEPQIVSPDLMVGIAGVASALRRVGSAVCVPRTLSVDGARHFSLQ